MKKAMLYVMCAMYLVAGIFHFCSPATYMGIMPPWLPYPAVLVFVSGVCEVLFALLLLPPASRVVAAWLIILLLLAVFPANIQMAINYYHTHNPHLWVAIARLPLQPVLIWWAWLYTRRAS